MSKKEKPTKITFRGQAARDFLKGCMESKEWPAHLRGAAEKIQKELKRGKKKHG